MLKAQLEYENALQATPQILSVKQPSNRSIKSKSPSIHS